MAIGLRELIDAGALRHMCMYHARRNGDDESWGKTLEYALREFRDIDDRVIVELIFECQQIGEYFSRYQIGIITHAEYDQIMRERGMPCSGSIQGLSGSND